MKRTGLNRRTPLRRQSTKRRAIAPRRRALVKKLLAEHPICQVCGEEPSTECHEKLTRGRGGSILDESNILCVGRSCHRDIHAHPAWAAAHGLLANSWDASPVAVGFDPTPGSAATGQASVLSQEAGDA